MAEIKYFINTEYGLKKGTSFKEKIATELQLKSWVNREKEMQRWNKILEDGKKSPNVNFMSFIVGDYGMGKTLTLLKILEKARHEDELYAIYLNLISEQKPKSPGLDVLQRIFKEIDFLNIKVKRQNVSILKDILPEVGNVYEKIIFSKDNDERFLAKAFLVGEIRATQSQLRKLGVIRKIDNVEIGKEYLLGILFLLKSAGFSTLVLALDEFEYLFSLVTKSAQSIYLALLRGLFDLPVKIPDELKDNIANMVFFIAISEDGFSRLKDLREKESAIGGPISPLMRRVTEGINLKALSKQDIEKLIERRLSFDRVKGKYQNEPLIPFSKSFVNYIFRLTRGKPGDVIIRCDHVLDAGIERKIPRLTQEFAREVFKERGFSY